MLYMQEAKDTLIVDGHLREAGDDLGSVCPPVGPQDIKVKIECMGEGFGRIGSTTGRKPDWKVGEVRKKFDKC